MKNNNKGFSLVELIVVIAIMAVLVGVLAPTLLRYVEKSRVQKDESAVEEVRNAVVIAMADENVYKQVANNDKITVAGSDGTMTFSNTGATNLKSEIEATVGTTIPISSKLHKGQNYVITITIDATTSNVKATGAWQS